MTDGPRDVTERRAGGERFIYLTPDSEVLDFVCEVLDFVCIEMRDICGGQPDRCEGSSTPLIARLCLSPRRHSALPLRKAFRRFVASRCALPISTSWSNRNSYLHPTSRRLRRHGSVGASALFAR
ncbi:hypothetical protein, partial [Rhodococcoides fascians]|uniref:hypothetical protein n=1 Tax=Rhodococcoides fascians TaxID=1828 RepID=UPI001E520754